MQSLWGKVHLGSMKMILRCLIAAFACISLFSSCSKEGPELRDDYQAEWAAAYYLGPGTAEGVNAFLLDLAQGRTDEDLELISSGAVMRLWVNSPVSGDISLPGGQYQGSVARDEVYTFHCDGQLSDGDVRSSYLGLRNRTAAQTQYFPIESGSLTVRRDGGAYRLTIRVQAGGREFTFAYEGEIPTTDCTETLKNL